LAQPAELDSDIVAAGRAARLAGGPDHPPAELDPRQRIAWQKGYAEAADAPDDQTRIADGFAAAHSSGTIDPPITQQPATQPAP
jgi:hypothetical protein